jgi:hypothetical protein
MPLVLDEAVCHLNSNTDGLKAPAGHALPRHWK